MDLNSPNNTNDLEKSGLIFFHRFLNAELSIYNTAFNICLNFLQKLWKEITVFVTGIEETVLIFAWQFFQIF